MTDIQATYRISGRFTTSGDASGLVAIDSLSFGYGGRAYACTERSDLDSDTAVGAAA